jgi:hypothetical protein
LIEDAEAIRSLLDRPVQTNEVGRCAALLPGFCAVASETGLPLRLLEIGASAGLNLRWDRYRYEARSFAWGEETSPVRIAFGLEGDPPQAAAAEVVERHGCDPRPIDPATGEGALTLLSFVWPDQLERLRRLQAALELSTEVPVSVDRARAAEWAAARLSAPRPGVATVVFHSIVMQYLSDAERREFEHAVRTAGEIATDDAPLAWLRMEPAGDRAEVRLACWPGGGDRLVGRVGYHGDPVRFSP